MLLCKYCRIFKVSYSKFVKQPQKAGIEYTKRTKGAPTNDNKRKEALSVRDYFLGFNAAPEDPCSMYTIKTLSNVLHGCFNVATWI